MYHDRDTPLLFGYFPTYRDSPLPAQWDRITQIGDASGMQSPLSFGGLAALLRHIPRLTDGMEDALLNDFLDRECLASLNQYQPALSASWLFQKCMSVSPVSVRPRGGGGWQRGVWFRGGLRCCFFCTLT